MNSPQRQQYLVHLQKKLNYSFKNIELLNTALTHRSFQAANNERLEFIGDGILDYVVAKMLFDEFPTLPEGRLSPLRAQLVRESSLAEIANEIQVGPALLLGIGERKSGGHNRPSILADALEAIFAAVSLDSDFQAAERVIQHLFEQRIKNIDISQNTEKDSKTQLQELLQAHRLALPKYRIEKKTGDGNNVDFDVSCDLGELGHITYAKGGSRRAAEKECAKQALLWLDNYLKTRR